MVFTACPEQATTEQPSHICCHWQGQFPFSDRIAPHHNETHLQWVKYQLHTRSLPPLCILTANVVACQECHFHPKYSHLGFADVCMWPSKWHGGMTYHLVCFCKMRTKPMSKTIVDSLTIWVVKKKLGYHAKKIISNVGTGTSGDNWDYKASICQAPMPRIVMLWPWIYTQ